MRTCVLLLAVWYAKPQLCGTDPFFESGYLSVPPCDSTTKTCSWNTLTFKEKYEKPVVIMGPLSGDGKQSRAASVRVKMDPGQTTSCQFRVVPFSDEFFVPTAESVSYFVFEAGKHEFKDGLALVAGIEQADGTATKKTFPDGFVFNSDPVVLTQVVSDTDPKVVMEWVQAVALDGFEVAVKGSRKDCVGPSNDCHGTEDVAYVAAETGSWNINGAQITISKTGQVELDPSTPANIAAGTKGYTLQTRFPPATANTSNHPGVIARPCPVNGVPDKDIFALRFTLSSTGTPPNYSHTVWLAEENATVAATPGHQQQEVIAFIAAESLGNQTLFCEFPARPIPDSGKNPTTQAPGPFEVNDGTEDGVEVAVVSQTDVNSREIHNYTITKGNENGAFLVKTVCPKPVSATTPCKGIIYVNGSKKFDGDLYPRYELTILVTDSTGESAETDPPVVINVIPIPTETLTYTKIPTATGEVTELLVPGVWVVGVMSMVTALMGSLSGLFGLMAMRRHSGWTDVSIGCTDNLAGFGFGTRSFLLFSMPDPGRYEQPTPVAVPAPIDLFSAFVPDLPVETVSNGISPPLYTTLVSCVVTVAIVFVIRMTLSCLQKLHPTAGQTGGSVTTSLDVRSGKGRPSPPRRQAKGPGGLATFVGLFNAFFPNMELVVLRLFAVLLVQDCVAVLQSKEFWTSGGFTLAGVSIAVIVIGGLIIGAFVIFRIYNTVHVGFLTDPVVAGSLHWYWPPFWANAVQTVGRLHTGVWRCSNSTTFGYRFACVFSEYTVQRRFFFIVQMIFIFAIAIVTAIPIACWKTWLTCAAIFLAQLIVLAVARPYNAVGDMPAHLVLIIGNMLASLLLMLDDLPSFNSGQLLHQTVLLPMVVALLIFGQIFYVCVRVVALINASLGCFGGWCATFVTMHRMVGSCGADDKHTFGEMARWMQRRAAHPLTPADLIELNDATLTDPAGAKYSSLHRPRASKEEDEWVVGIKNLASKAHLPACMFLPSDIAETKLPYAPMKS